MNYFKDKLCGKKKPAESNERRDIEGGFQYLQDGPCNRSTAGNVNGVRNSNSLVSFSQLTPNPEDKGTLKVLPNKKKIDYILELVNNCLVRWFTAVFNDTILSFFVQR